LAAENRLTIEQLAALSPGDVVVAEVSGDFRRPRRITGTVVRLEGSQIVVSERSARGVAYVNRYSRRDGLRIGRGSLPTAPGLVSGMTSRSFVTCSPPLVTFSRPSSVPDGRTPEPAHRHSLLVRLGSRQAAPSVC
jgi:hypothetical protein